MSDPIGASVRRGGGYDRVTGRQKYVGDLHLEDLLHVKLVHLDVARARIRSIDTTAAAAFEGVRCVLTSADLGQPAPRFGPVYEDRPILALGETKYHGQPVAAVAAETKAAAEAAAELVRVDYEELPGVFTVAAALDPASPIVQEPELRPNDPLRRTNTLRERRYGWGNVDAARADLVVENNYSFPMVTHFAIEPHGFTAAPATDGIVVWSATQNPFQMQRIIARVLKLPLASVRIIAPDSGGAFGGKQHPKYEPLVAVLAQRTGRPVRLVLTLEETFQEVRRTSCEIHARTGFNADGTIAFQDIQSNFLMGAYADIAERVIAKSNYLACGPYRVPNARIIARALLSHTTPSTAFRGFGTPQVAWAHSWGWTGSRSASVTWPAKARHSYRTTRRPTAIGRSRCARLPPPLAGGRRLDPATGVESRLPSRNRRPPARRMRSSGCIGTAAPRCLPGRQIWVRVRGPSWLRSPQTSSASLSNRSGS